MPPNPNLPIPGDDEKVPYIEILKENDELRFSSQMRTSEGDQRKSRFTT
jgi:hypothetical protein